jgi:hypothetical protein
MTTYLDDDEAQVGQRAALAMILQDREEENPFPTSTTVFNNIRKAPMTRVV